MRHAFRLASLLAALIFWPAGAVEAADGKGRRAEKEASKEPSAPADYRSQRFLIHTDLAETDAKELLERLETMLSLISAYWGRPPSGVIECYVVDKLQRWPDGAIPEAGLPSIKAGAGITITQKLSSGERFVARSVVCAVADRGTPQHEAVHAYCGQTFGRTGPVWYSEGMAEMGNYWRKGRLDVQVPDLIVEYLRASSPKSLNGIVNNTESTGDSWQNYAWRWALCHLLEHNPNYKARFRPLGIALLTERADLHPSKKTTFEKVYGDVADEISFEYLFFLQHVANGYRTDLCSWDWKRKFLGLTGRATLAARIRADRGWQPSGVIVAAGQSYQYTATGTWKLSADGPATTADGAEPDGDKSSGEQGDQQAGRSLADLLNEPPIERPGRLLGVVLTERELPPGEQARDPSQLKYQLGEPFELGASGTFTAPAAGRLYLRAADAWSQLADNKGQMTVKLRLAK